MPALDRFDCTIYSPDAKPQAKGRYVLVGGDPREPIGYREWDGRTLTVSGNRIMAPEKCVQPGGVVRCP